VAPAVWQIAVTPLLYLHRDLDDPPGAQLTPLPALPLPREPRGGGQVGAAVSGKAMQVFFGSSTLRLTKAILIFAMKPLVRTRQWLSHVTPKAVRALWCSCAPSCGACAIGPRVFILRVI
jgi:hypothetical protein